MAQRRRNSISEIATDRVTFDLCASDAAARGCPKKFRFFSDRLCVSWTMAANRRRPRPGTCVSSIQNRREQCSPDFFRRLSCRRRSIVSDDWFYANRTLPQTRVDGLLPFIRFPAVSRTLERTCLYKRRFDSETYVVSETFLIFKSFMNLSYQKYLQQSVGYIFNFW